MTRVRRTGQGLSSGAQRRGSRCGSEPHWAHAPAAGLLSHDEDDRLRVGADGILLAQLLDRVVHLVHQAGATLAEADSHPRLPLADIDHEHRRPARRRLRFGIDLTRIAGRTCYGSTPFAWVNRRRAVRVLRCAAASSNPCAAPS